ncbi:MAG: cytochrome ubiquinol oxidase subunit II [Sphingomonas sp.]|nr:cytochrome ubiquinol oxidase subunit II [Sphingomonas sp.]
MRAGLPARCRSLLLLLLAAPLSACAHTPSFFQAAGPVAAEQRDLFWIVTALLMLVVLPVFIGLPYVLWRFRQGNRQSDYRPTWDFSWKLEWLVWGVPVVVVAILGVVLWTTTHRLDPYKRLPGKSEVRVQAVALDWKWLFIYPDQHIATVNRLVIPVGRPVHIDLTSDTVMQSLMIPQLGGQIYAMAGMRTQLNLKADRPGSYFGENTQYNGKGFHKQNFETLAVPSAAFDAWAAQTAQGDRPLDRATYARLSQESVIARPISFSAVPAGMFDRIMRKYMYPEHKPVSGPAGDEAMQ